MKFNLNNLENKLNKISDTSIIINNTINNFDNKKKNRNNYLYIIINFSILF